MMRHNYPTGTLPLAHIRTAMFTILAVSVFSATGMLLFHHLIMTDPALLLYSPAKVSRKRHRLFEWYMNRN